MPSCSETARGLRGKVLKNVQLKALFKSVNPDDVTASHGQAKRAHLGMLSG